MALLRGAYAVSYRNTNEQNQGRSHFYEKQGLQRGTNHGGDIYHIFVLIYERHLSFHASNNRQHDNAESRGIQKYKLKTQQ